MSLKDTVEIIARDIGVLDKRVDRLASHEQVFTIRSSEVVINEAGIDVDLRIEGDTDPNLLFVDAGNDRIGIGTNAPAGKLHIFEDGGIALVQLMENDGSNNEWNGYCFSNIAWHGSYFAGYRSRGTRAIPIAINAFDTLFDLRGGGYDGAAFGLGGGAILFQSAENWGVVAHGTRIVIQTTSNGAAAFHISMIIQDGIQVGAPVGGDKGIGTINVATDVFKNNVAYANPDYVLEHHYRGKIEKFIDNLGAAEYEGLMNLLDVDKFMDDNLHLPQIHREPMGIFARSDAVLLHLEQIYLYLIDHEKRMREFEDGN